MEEVHKDEVKLEELLELPTDDQDESSDNNMTYEEFKQEFG
jgi:hypothetical protein